MEIAPSIIMIVQEAPTQQRTERLEKKAEKTRISVHCFRQTKKKERLKKRNISKYFKLLYIDKPQQSKEDTEKCEEAERDFEMRYVLLVLFVCSPVVRIWDIDLDCGLHQTDEGDQNGETEDCQEGLL